MLRCGRRRASRDSAALEHLNAHADADADADAERVCELWWRTRALARDE